MLDAALIYERLKVNKLQKKSILNWPAVFNVIPSIKNLQLSTAVFKYANHSRTTLWFAF